MHLAPPLWVVALGWIAGLPVLAVAVLVAPWSRLRHDAFVHAWCAGLLALVLLWSAARALPGAHVYLLGTAAYALIVGPSLALAGAAAALAVTMLLHGGMWVDAGLAYGLLALLPVGVATGVRRIAQHVHGAHPVVLSYFEGTAAGALAAAASTLAGAALLHGSGAGTVVPEWDLVWATAVCLACLEALVTSVLAIVWALHGPLPEQHANRVARSVRGSRGRAPLKR